MIASGLADTEVQESICALIKLLKGFPLFEQFGNSAHMLESYRAFEREWLLAHARLVQSLAKLSRSHADSLHETIPNMCTADNARATTGALLARLTVLNEGNGERG